MYMNKKVGEDAILVTDTCNSNVLSVRHAGSANKYTERDFLKIESGEILISKSLCDEFNLKIKIIDTLEKSHEEMDLDLDLD